MQLMPSDVIFGLSSLFFGTGMGIYAWSLYIERKTTDITRKVSYAMVMVNLGFWSYAYIEAASFGIPLQPRHVMGLVVAISWNLVGIWCYERRKRDRHEAEDRERLDRHRQAANQDPA